MPHATSDECGSGFNGGGDGSGGSGGDEGRSARMAAEWRAVEDKQRFGASFDEVARTQLCADYLQALGWCAHYYYQGCPDWRFFLGHHYAPFAFDLARYAPRWAPARWGDAPPLQPLEQLFCVLPPASAPLLPASYADALRARDTALAEIAPLFPDEIELDYRGKKHAWQAVVLLPFLPLARVLALLAPLPLSDAEGARGANENYPLVFTAATATLAAAAAASAASVAPAAAPVAAPAAAPVAAPAAGWVAVGWEAGALAGHVAILRAAARRACLKPPPCLASPTAMPSSMSASSAPRVWVARYAAPSPTPHHRSVLLGAGTPLQPSLTWRDLVAAGGRLGRGSGAAAAAGEHGRGRGRAGVGAGGRGAGAMQPKPKPKPSGGTGKRRLGGTAGDAASALSPDGGGGLFGFSIV